MFVAGGGGCLGWGGYWDDCAVAGGGDVSDDVDVARVGVDYFEVGVGCFDGFVHVNVCVDAGGRGMVKKGG